MAVEFSFEVSVGGRGERAGKKLAKLLHHGLGQHVQDVEIHGQLLADSTAMKLRFKAVKPGDHVRRPWGKKLDRGRVGFTGTNRFSVQPSDLFRCFW